MREKMQKLLFAIISALTPAICLAQQGETVSLQAESHSGGPMYRWSISEQRNMAQERWTPAKGNPPLPVNKATANASAWLKKKHPDVKDLAVASVQLSPVGFGQPPGDRWFYRIEFNPVIGGNVLRGGSFVAVVLFDGSIVEPRIDKAGK